MAFGVVMIGMVLGGVGAAVSLALGASVLIALLSCSFAGSAAILAVAAMVALRSDTIPTRGAVLADGIAKNAL